MEISFRVPAADLSKLKEEISRARRSIRSALKQATYTLALDLQREIRAGIRSGAPGGKRLLPNAPSTIAMKGSSKPLIHHSDLVNSIRTYAMHARGQAAYFVGVHRMARGRDGQELANLAELHELGGRQAYSIPVTPRLRRFWYAMYKKGIFAAPLGPRTTVIHHPPMPARPFLVPAFDAWKAGAENLYHTYVARQLRRVPRRRR